MATIRQRKRLLESLVSLKTALCMTDIANDYNDMFDAIELIRCCIVPDEGGKTYHLEGNVKGAIKAMDRVLAS